MIPAHQPAQLPTKGAARSAAETQDEEVSQGASATQVKTKRFMLAENTQLCDLFIAKWHDIYGDRACLYDLVNGVVIHVEDSFITLGAHDISQVEETQQVITGVEKHFPHLDFKRETTNNNHVKLFYPAQLNHYIKTIALTFSSSDLPKDTSCKVAGWGLIDLGIQLILFETNVTVVSHNFCCRYHKHLTKGMSCARDDINMADARQGDSGGPLICDRVLEDVVSFGHDHPLGVYARVGHYCFKETMSEYKGIDP
ncbi:mast cell protease 3-like [Gastrophryne carolinensis]